MDNSDGDLPRIPDDWSRETMRVNSKTVKNIQSTNHAVGGKSKTGGGPSKDVQAQGNVPKSARKRKRNLSACNSASIAPVPSSVHSHPINTIHSQPDDKSDSGMLSQDVVPKNMTISKDAAPPVSSKTQGGETESVMKGLYYQVEKLARRPGCALQEGIYLDSIMTHIPYTDVLEQMFGGNAVTDSACVPVVTRAYEESYMRESMGVSEDNCIMGANCECQFIDEQTPFIGVQFTLPVEAFSSMTTTSAMIEELSSNKLCVLCCRKNTQSLFYEALYNHRAYSSCIQLYGNICDRPGEYAKEAMLICPLSGPVQNMPLPVVAHQRNRYSVVDYNGIRQLRQHRVGYEDFQTPSSSRF
jgi:hypothetical protein